MSEQGYSNVFFIFRNFTHNRYGTDNKTKLLNKYENLSIKNLRYQHQKGVSNDPNFRRPFNHLEIILWDKRWFGIKNGANDTVFLKDRINFETKASKDYPQIVMIQIDEQTKINLRAFCNLTVENKFDSCSLFWNMITKHFLGLPFLSKINKKNQWYCTKLSIEFLRYGNIVTNADLDALTATAEDIYWLCVDKQAETKNNKELPKFYVYPYGDYPDDIFEKSRDVIDIINVN